MADWGKCNRNVLLKGRTTTPWYTKFLSLQRLFESPEGSTETICFSHPWRCKVDCGCGGADRRRARMLPFLKVRIRSEPSDGARYCSGDWPRRYKGVRDEAFYMSTSQHHHELRTFEHNPEIASNWLDCMTNNLEQLDPRFSSMKVPRNRFAQSTASWTMSSESTRLRTSHRA